MTEKLRPWRVTLDARKSRVPFAVLRVAYRIAVDTQQDNADQPETIRDYWPACVEMVTDLRATLQDDRAAPRSRCVMKVMVQGQGIVELGQREFVASGGEGQVFRRGQTAFKVYTDPKKALPVGKITELGRIADPHVIRPQSLLVDPKSAAPLGYTMAYVERTLPLCQMFTRAYREREGLTPVCMLDLVVRLRDLIAQVHAADVLVVDLNEMNFLVDDKHAEIYAIDVDSYQTRSYPATAIMPSVRDWSVKTSAGFSRDSDWFSFAILAFQLLVAIHPYKGKHPKITGLEERMRANASAFDVGVTLPKVVYPIDGIPGAMRAWMQAVLQDGKRCPPPADLRAGDVVVVLAMKQVAQAAGVSLEIVEVAAFAEDIVGYVERSGKAVAWSASGKSVIGCAFVTGQRASVISVRAVGFTEKMNVPILAEIQRGQLKLWTSPLPVQLEIEAQAVMSQDGRIYVQSDDHIVEVELSEVVTLKNPGGSVMASPRIVANILGQSTRLFEGMAVQNLLGRIHLSIFPRSGEHYEIRVAELDRYAIVDAKCDGRMVMVVASQHGSGRYDRLSFELAEDFSSCKLIGTVQDIQPSGLNFITLGDVVVHLTEEDVLEVRRIGGSGMKTIKDPRVTGECRLVKHQGRAAFIQGRHVYSMRMK